MPSVGPVGWLVNGVALYGWSDGLSFNSGNVWQNVAMEFEKYELDVCYGMSTSPSNRYHRKCTLTSVQQVS